MQIDESTQCGCTWTQTVGAVRRPRSHLLTPSFLGRDAFLDPIDGKVDIDLQKHRFSVISVIVSRMSSWKPRRLRTPLHPKLDRPPAFLWADPIDPVSTGSAAHRPPRSRRCSPTPDIADYVNHSPIALIRRRRYCVAELLHPGP